MSEYAPAHSYSSDQNRDLGASSSAEEKGVPFFEAVANYGEEMGARLDMAFKYIEHDDPACPKRIEDSVYFIATAFEAMADDVAYEANPKAMYYFPEEIADAADDRQFVCVGGSYDLAAGFVEKYRDQLTSNYLHQNTNQPDLLAKIYGSCGTILHRSAERSLDVVGDMPQVRRAFEDASIFYHKALGHLMSSHEAESAQRVEYYGRQALQVDEILTGRPGGRNARFLGRIIARYGR